MDAPRPILELPDDAAVAATDGSMCGRGASAGVVLVHAGRVHLDGFAVSDAGDSWDAEAAGAARAIRMARDLGARRLRLLVDHLGIATLLQGRRPDAPEPREDRLAGCVDEAGRAGLAVSVRLVQGHAETLDLPSRMNDVAHLLGDMGLEGGYAGDLPLEPDWADRLAAADPRFRQRRKHLRWIATLPRRRTAHFLGVDVGTVDALARAGHLDVTADGVTRRSAAAVYEFAQAMRHADYFGFDATEGVPGRHMDEVCRGWDGRKAGRDGRHHAASRPHAPSVATSPAVDTPRPVAA